MDADNPSGPIASADALSAAATAIAQGSATEPAAPASAPAPAPVAGTDAGHPAYQEILAAVPEMFHDAVLPTLKKWDSGVTQKLDAVHSQYSKFQGLEDFDPSDVKTAMNLLGVLNNNPRDFYDHLGSTYGFVGGQGQEEQDSGEVDLGEYGSDPAIQQLNGQIKSLQEQLNGQVQAQALKEQQVWLDGKFNTVEQTFKDAGLELTNDHREYIATRALNLAEHNGHDFEKAIDAARDQLIKMLSPGTPVAAAPQASAANASAPPVMAVNGAPPATPQVSMNELTSAQRRALGVQALAALSRPTS